MNLIKNNLKQLRHLCEIHNVATMYVFGSAITGHFNKKSDVDFLVRFKEFDPAGYFLNYMSFKNELNLLLNRDVDLVEEQTLKNPVLISSIENSKQLIYG